MKTKIKKSKLCGLIFPILCKGIIAGYKHDNEIKAELNKLPNDFSISLGIFPYGSYVRLVRINGRFFTTKQYSPSDLEIIFKSIASAKATMLAKQNVAESFSKHQILLSGDISKALILVRVINKIECYLFPRFMTKKILPPIQKQCSTLRMYSFVLFKNTKIPKQIMEVKNE